MKQGTTTTPASTSTTPNKRTMSASAKKRIAAAQKKRWANRRGQATPATAGTGTPQAGGTGGIETGGMRIMTRRDMEEAAKACRTRLAEIRHNITALLVEEEVKTGILRGFEGGLEKLAQAEAGGTPKTLTAGGGASAGV